MAEIIDYARILAGDIGPRPATSASEHQAAEWLATTFGAHGLETEIQEFMAPRTYAWAYAIYHLLTLASAFAAGFKPYLVWPALAVSAIVAFFFIGDLDLRWGLSRIMPKGPSQNVIAKHIPRARRGERLLRIVVVAHYDSARASLAFAPGMVKRFPVTFALMKWCTFLTPVMILAMALPFTTRLDPWIWYATMAVAAYLIIPLLINVHRELFMPFVAGANDNASGVAAMLGVMEGLVPSPDDIPLVAGTGRFPAVGSDLDPLAGAGTFPGTDPPSAPDPLLGADPLLGTGRGADTAGSFPQAAPVGSGADAFGALGRSDGPAEQYGPRSQPRADARAKLTMDTVEFEAVGAARGEQGAHGSFGADDTGRASADFGRAATDFGRAATGLSADAASGISGADQDRAEFLAATTEPATAGSESRREGKARKLFGRFGRKKQRPKEGDEVSGWLGVDESFDARQAGREIGSWDNFGSEEDDGDDHGWKGGWAGDDPIGDPGFAADEAARIRRRVTENIDRELTEKEIWFVATGAEEVGCFGMQAFIHEYAEELRDAMIINIDGCGAGRLYWVSAEGMLRRYQANQRLVGLARRVSRTTSTVIKPRVYRGLSTDATPALARKYKAISIMALDADGLPANWHWKTDTADNLDPALINQATELVSAMVRDA
ncbi:MAG: M28 family peptidase [Coriobacteriia bacterium]|nr:M28 family peptidase [Coriobacteriia bacterium]